MNHPFKVGFVWLFALLFLPQVLWAQVEVALVFFKDKTGTEHRLEEPATFLSERALLRRERQGIALTERDLPVSKVYLDQVKAMGARVMYTTKWLNGALLEADRQVLKEIQEADFTVSREFPLGTLQVNAMDESQPLPPYVPMQPGQVFDYGNSFTQNSQTGIDKMHEAGFLGEGIRIAITDAGFFRADQIAGFDSLFANQRVVATWDFVAHEPHVYEDNRHGMQVLSVLAGYEPGRLIGAAFRAEYVLLRTENAASENRLEEFNWLVGAEFADSLGVDIINVSLGYNLFDQTRDDYKKKQLDGNTALITIAADLAVATGMLVVSSAGNEGSNSWRTLTAPADGDSVLAVGATNTFGLKAPFSSHGPSADRRVKPDVAAQGSGVIVYNGNGQIGTNSGTSFAAPLVTGLAAGLWQAYPSLSVMELVQLIKQSSSQFHAPDSLLGFGVPDFQLARAIMETTGKAGAAPLLQGIAVYPNPFNDTLYLDLPTRPQPYTILVHTLDGKQVLTHNFLSQGNPLELDFTGLQPGMYVVGIHTPEGKRFFRIQKGVR